MPAKDLYCSDWFLKASRYAQIVTDQWFILSAKYGLVLPDEIIAPYDKTLNKMSAEERRGWARKVFLQLDKVLLRRDLVIFIAFKKYREHLIEPVQDMGCYVEVPIEGLRIGEPLSWLGEQIEKIDE